MIIFCTLQVCFFGFSIVTVCHFAMLKNFVETRKICPNSVKDFNKIIQNKKHKIS